MYDLKLYLCMIRISSSLCFVISPFKGKIYYGISGNFIKTAD